MSNESRTIDFQVRVHHESPSGYWAEVVELPGCFASGFTVEELDESLREAIELYLSTNEHHISATHVSPPVESGLAQSTGRHARPDMHVESRKVELTLQASQFTFS